MTTINHQRDQENFTGKSSFKKNIRFVFDDELKIEDARYDTMTKIIIKVQLI